jgi:hypothetical protein
MSNVVKIEYARYLQGVMHWALLQPLMVPKFEVFKYIGRDRDNGLYYFKAVRGRAIISRNFYQLNVPYFKPFLINHERMTGQPPDRIKTNANL